MKENDGDIRVVHRDELPSCDGLRMRVPMHANEEALLAAAFDPVILWSTICDDL